MQRPHGVSTCVHRRCVRSSRQSGFFPLRGSYVQSASASPAAWRRHRRPSSLARAQERAFVGMCFTSFSVKEAEGDELLLKASAEDVAADVRFRFFSGLHASDRCFVAAK